MLEAKWGLYPTSIRIMCSGEGGNPRRKPFMVSTQFRGIALGSNILQGRCLSSKEPSNTHYFVARSGEKTDKPCWMRDFSLLAESTRLTSFTAVLCYLTVQARIVAFSSYVWVWRARSRMLETGWLSKSVKGLKTSLGTLKTKAFLSGVSQVLSSLSALTMKL